MTCQSLRRLIAMIGAGCIGAVTLAGTAASAGTAYDLSWHRIAGGGGSSEGGGFTLSGTIGQHDAGSASGGSFTMAGGFWSGVVDLTPPCPADLSGDGIVNSTDLLELLTAWGSCPSPCPADLNGDEIVNSTDLLILLNAWGPC